ncbi:glycosyltransferase family 2 protein [Zooshikella harenae]|uniref:Glycosyltransferase family 2 protein n=1 Tax=Zooshikella harenae TaxID=2827238 RepID=A0ABS5Z8K9_9GAMM|nr:glycosyltransferase family 2 protein [Zooshikella harenae]MBU2710379.1 glycosyltransferase family 2 protein [Zooshikella harenae]
MNPKLSICIPTYNRGQYIGDTLEKILNQNDPLIQVVISDNASTDYTEDIVASYLDKGVSIKYFKWTENMGADKNYLKAAELADGEYIWFLGSDDWICNGAICKVLELLDTYSTDILLCSEYLCDLVMKPYSVHYLLGEGVSDRVFNLSNRCELIEYFSIAQSHSALFGYLSSIIVSKKRWDAIAYDDKYTGTLYSHMFILYSIVFEGASLYYISKPLVMWRSGNDSFGGKGKITERYLIDIVGFKMIINDFFKSDLELIEVFTGAFRRHHPYKNIGYLRMHTASQLKWNDIRRELIDSFGYSESILKLLSVSYAPSILKAAFLFYRVQMKISRLITNVNMH